MNQPLGNTKTAKHSYDVEVWCPTTHKRITLDVHANNRDQAARIAVKAGFVQVCSVNMTG